MELNWRGFPKGESYFDELPKSTQTLIRKLTEIAHKQKLRIETLGDSETSDLECRSRDGFIPYSHNKGGVRIQSFTDLGSIWSSGRYPKASQSRDKLELLIDESLKEAQESFFSDNEKELKALRIVSKEEIYDALVRLNNFDLANRLSEYEIESLSGDYSRVMFETRVMYHGKQKGIHSMTVFASMSATDAPYHRTSDVQSEELVTWRTEAGLERKLSKALRKVAKDVF